MYNIQNVNSQWTEKVEKLEKERKYHKIVFKNKNSFEMYVHVCFKDYQRRKYISRNTSIPIHLKRKDVTTKRTSVFPGRNMISMLYMLKYIQWNISLKVCFFSQEWYSIIFVNTIRRPLDWNKYLVIILKSRILIFLKFSLTPEITKSYS